MGGHSLISSSFITATVILCLLKTSSVLADVVEVNAKFGGPPVTRFTTVAREIKLVCTFDETDLSNNTKPQWSFLNPGSNGTGTVSVLDEDVASTCGKSSKREGPKILRVCDVKWNSKDFQLVLDIDDLNEPEFGDYVCHTGNRSGKHTVFKLRELVYLTRNENKKHLVSVNLVEGTKFELYCNQTGLKANSHKISWWKDGENITEALNDGTGLFQNFTKDDKSPSPLYYRGVATMDHRGSYMCQVDLLNPEDPEIGRFYPISNTYFVRVKHGNEWQLPVYILAGECALIGLFTIFINWKESRIKDEDMESEEDSDDEDEPTGNQNGKVQNNNGK